MECLGISLAETHRHFAGQEKLKPVVFRLLILVDLGTGAGVGVGGASPGPFVLSGICRRLAILECDACHVLDIFEIITGHLSNGNRNLDPVHFVKVNLPVLESEKLRLDAE